MTLPAQVEGRLQERLSVMGLAIFALLFRL